MYRSSWIHQADIQRRQARRRDASVMATIFLVGALAVSWFILRPDITALLP